jgi:hypothetical protein
MVPVGGGAGMTIGPKTPAVTADYGRLRTSRAERERVIDTLNLAFADGRLDKDELDARVGQALTSRTCAELTVLTGDLPAGPAQIPPPDPAATAWPARLERLERLERAVRSRPAARALSRGLAATAMAIAPVLFFESFLRGSNEALTELFFLITLLDLIVVTLAAGNPLLNRLEDRRTRAAGR